MGTSRTGLGDALFGDTRQAVLGLLFGDIEKRFVQGQVIATLGMGSGTVQRELERLRSSGIVTRSVEGRQIYYRANPECPVFDELRGLVRKTIGAPRVLSAALEPLASRIELAFIYGSVAEGSETSSSDVDVLLVGDVSLMEVVEAIEGAQRSLGRDINPMLYTAREFRRKLAEGQHFLTRVMGGEKVFLIGDEQRAKRVAEVRVAPGAHDQPVRNRRSAGGR